MTEGLKNAILCSVSTVVGAAMGVVCSFIIYADQKQTTIETTEQATVEKLSDIYDNVTKDMSYEEAFTIVFQDYESAEKEKEDLNEELKTLQNEKNELNEKIDEFTRQLEEKQKIIDGNASDIDRTIEEKANEYADSGDYLRALVELKGIVNVTPSIELLIKEYTQKYEADVTQKVNNYISEGKLDEADKLVDEGLKYISDSQVLKDLKERIKGKQAKKMIDVVPANQNGGDEYYEYSLEKTGGKSFLMGSEKYTDGIVFHSSRNLGDLSFKLQL